MKITHNKVGQNLNIKDNAKSDKTNTAKNPLLDASKDTSNTDKNSGISSSSFEASKVQVSDRGLQANKIKELALAAPDVDQAKVEKFRKLIDEGNYKVNAQAVADKMVDEEMDFLG